MKVDKMNVLVAFPYMSEATLKLLETIADRSRFLLDCGAFSAWRVGKKIDMDEYCSFLRDLPVAPWRYFALDVIGEPEATRRNYQVMLDRGFTPVPIFTRGESLDELDRLFETSDLVGLGGVTAADRLSYGWVKAVMNHAAGRRVHILGFTSMDWLKFTKPFSADSSSWLMGARYGMGFVYMGQGNFYRIKRQDVEKAIPKREVMNRIQQLGFDPWAFQKKEHWTGNRGTISQLSAVSWLAAATEIEQQLGTLLFLAFANNLFLRNLIDAFEMLKRINVEA